MTKQIPTRTTKVSAIIRSAAFVRGFNEVQKGLPMDYDVYSKADEVAKRWDYERGRQFGFLYAGKLKNGQTVIHDAIWTYADASYLKWVC